MTYNPQKHHRRSIRMKGYDYSQEGAYFITICTYNKECIFGEIKNGEMILNERGEIARDELINLQQRFSQIQTDIFQIMPNHLHCILFINETIKPVGAGLAPAQIGAANVGFDDNQNKIGTNVETRVTARVAPTIGNIIGAYKSLVFTKCLQISKTKNQILGKLWQRNYHEHIIRNYESYLKIYDYIFTNPVHWQDDQFYVIKP